MIHHLVKLGMADQVPIVLFHLEDCFELFCEFLEVTSALSRSPGLQEM